MNGFSLLEVMVVVTILGLLAALAAPRYAVAREQAVVDRGAAELRSIWSAQRIYWLERRTYAASVAKLREARLLDELGKEFRFRVTTAGSGFIASAERVESSWRGTLRIDATGRITGTLHSGVWTSVQPAP